MFQLLTQLQAATAAAQALLAAARQEVTRRCAPAGRAEPALLTQHQRALHGLAWMATTVQAIDTAAAWAGKLAERGALGEGEELVLVIGVGEYLAQLAGGIPMSQTEIFRPAEIGLVAAAAALAADAGCAALLARALDLGGSTLRDFRDAHGLSGAFQAHAAVYGRAGQPCGVCGQPVRRIVQAQRSTFFCASCQHR